MTIEVIHGDCVDIMPRYNGRVDLIVTSPPYDDLRPYAGQSAFDFPATCDAIFDVLAPGGILCWNVQDQQKEGDYTLTSHRQALAFQDRGLLCREKLIYQKHGARITGTNYYHRAYEYVYVFTKGRPTAVNILADRVNLGAGRSHGKGDTGRVGDAKPKSRKSRYIVDTHGPRTDVWTYAAGMGNSAPDDPEAHDVHPALMPLKLAQDLIRSFSNEGDLVMDPFGGAGTTAKAAKYLLRDCVSIDINEEYCDYARRRTAQELLT